MVRNTIKEHQDLCLAGMKMDSKDRAKMEESDTLKEDQDEKADGEMVVASAPNSDHRKMASETDVNQRYNGSAKLVRKKIESDTSWQKPKHKEG